MPCDKSPPSPSAVAKPQPQLRDLARGQAKPRHARQIHARTNAHGIDSRFLCAERCTHSTCYNTVKDEEVDIELPSGPRYPALHVPEVLMPRCSLEYINRDVDPILHTFDDADDSGHTNVKREENQHPEIGEDNKANGSAPVEKERKSREYSEMSPFYDPTFLVSNERAPPNDVANAPTSTNVPAPSNALAPPDPNGATGVLLPEDPDAPGGPMVYRKVPFKVAARGLRATQAWAEEIDRLAISQGRAPLPRRRVWLSDREPSYQASAPPRDAPAAPEVPSAAENRRFQLAYWSQVHGVLAQIINSGAQLEHLINSLQHNSNLGVPVNELANPALPPAHVDNYRPGQTQRAHPVAANQDALRSRAVGDPRQQSAPQAPVMQGNSQARDTMFPSQPVYQGYQRTGPQSAYNAAMDGQGVSAFNNNAVMYGANPGGSGSVSQ